MECSPELSCLFFKAFLFERFNFAQLMREVSVDISGCLLLSTTRPLHTNQHSSMHTQNQPWWERFWPALQYVRVTMLRRSSHVWLFVTHGLGPARLLCPWDSLHNNTGEGSQALLQQVFPAQGQNSHLLCVLHWQVGSLPLVNDYINHRGWWLQPQN